MKILCSESEKVLSEKLYALARTALAEEKEMLILVPAQASFLVESEIMRRCAVKGFMDIEVVSFEKLTERVASLAGGRVLATLDASGFAMLAKLAMMRKQKELHVLDLQDAVLHEKIAELIAALKSEGISYMALRDQAKNLSGRSAEKLQDIACIYEEMGHLSLGTLFDAREMERFCAARFNTTAYITQKEVVLYGFDVLPQSRMQTIVSLAAAARATTLLMEAGQAGILESRWKNVERLLLLLKQGGIEGETEILPLPREEGEIAHLWENMYAYPYRKYRERPADIVLAALPSRRAEVEQAAARILELTCEDGLRMRDIGVLAGMPEQYASLIKDVFSQAGIPFFLQNKRSLVKSALATHILSLLHILENWRLYDVFSYLKAGFCCSGQEADLLIRYATEYGLKGHMFKKDRKQAPEEWNILRARVFDPVLQIQMRAKEESLPDLLLAHLETVDAEQKVEIDAADMQKAGFHAEARYLEQVYPALSDLLEAAKILPDISPRALREVLAAGFTSKNISVVPPTTDEVLVGDITHSILGEKKVLCILGLNDGMLPVPVDPSGIVTAYEIAALRETLPNFPDKMSFSDQKAYIRKAFTAAQRLYISYNRTDGQPSYIVDRLKKLFPLLEEEKELVPLRSAAASMDALAEELRDSMDGYARPGALTAAYLAQQRERLTRLLAPLEFKNEPADIGPAAARELYQGMRASVSRIESYYNCPYRHFIQHGLRPKEVQAFEEDTASAGTYIHQIMDGFTDDLARAGKDWAEISDAELTAAVDRVADTLLQEHNRGIFTEKRFRFTEKRLREEAVFAARAVRAQLSGTNVRIAAGEAGFGGDILSIPTSFGKLTLRGRIDRIDEAVQPDGDEMFLRIVDYKTGEKNFSLTDVFYGVGLQLLVYLMAAESRYRSRQQTVTPAGGFYFSIDLPYIEEGEEESVRLGKFRMNGFILASYDAAVAMDASSSGKLTSMNATINAAEETLGNAGNVFSRREMREIFRYTERLITRAAEEIFGGKLAIRPLEANGQLPCRYCEYAAICMRDEELPANRAVQAKSLNKDEFFKEVGDNG